jgi:iron complex transport system substrate-binding protein
VRQRADWRLLVLATDTLGRLAFAPLQIPAGIVIALVGCPFLLLLWRRRDALNQEGSYALVRSLLLLLRGPSAPPTNSNFTDDLGRTVTVPLHPQRIVSMHDLDITIPLIELGVPPVASHGRTRPDGSHYLRSSAQLTGVDFDNSDIRFIGTADIDLEAVAAAKPDLIITEPSRHVSVEQLEKIAPTVSIDHLQGSAPEFTASWRS